MSTLTLNGSKVPDLPLIRSILNHANNKGNGID